MKPIYHNPELELFYCRQEHLTRWHASNLSAPFWRFYWNRTPGAWMELDGDRTDLDPEQFYLIPPNTPFAGHLDRPVEHLYLHFSTREPYASVRPQLFSFPLRGDLQELVLTISERLQAGNHQDQAFRVMALALVYLALTKVPAEELKPHRTDPRIERVLERMDVHLGEKQSNDELAAVAGMHPHAFTRLFAKITGQSPQKYLSVKRVERACTLLHNTSISIKEVAAALGFCDRYHFSRVFKQVRGISPAAFQRLLPPVSN